MNAEAAPDGPADPPDPPAPRAGNADDAGSSPPPQPGAARTRVLAVDDSLIDRKMVGRLLEQAGYEFTMTASARAALDALAAGPAYDVLLADVRMPGMDGFELLQRVRELYGDTLTVIMLSGDDDEATVRQCLLGGADSYMSKPIRPQEVRLLWQFAYQRAQEARRIDRETEHISDLSKKIVELEVQVRYLKQRRDARELRRRSLLAERQEQQKAQLSHIDSDAASDDGSVRSRGDSDPASPIWTPGSGNSPRGRPLPHSVAVCRICEEPVPASSLRAHTKMCRRVAEAAMARTDGEEALALVLAEVARLQRDGMQLALHEAMAAFEQRAAPLRRVEQLARAAQAANEREPLRLLARQARGLAAHPSWDVVRVARLADNAISTKSEARELYAALVSAGDETAAWDRYASVGAPLKVRLSDFEILRPLSRGAYGSVYLARKRSTGHQYAIKALPLREVISRNQVHNVSRERSVLAQTSCRFLTQLYYSFRTHDKLFLVMEYLRGGDLATLLGNLSALPEEAARFYIAGAVLAVAHLHAAGIVHRDIKPDNLLIADDGFVKLTDFGLSARIGSGASADDEDGHDDLLRSCVGTPGYIAPEVYAGGGYSGAADLWSLGNVIYELIYGAPPFLADTVAEIVTLTRQASAEALEFPRDDAGEHYCSAEARDLISALLQPDPALRPSPEAVMRHPFFAGVDFERPDTWVPPFVPSASDNYHDARNATAGAAVERGPEGFRRVVALPSAADEGDDGPPPELDDEEVLAAEFASAPNLDALTRSNLEEATDVSPQDGVGGRVLSSSSSSGSSGGAVLSVGVPPSPRARRWS